MSCRNKIKNKTTERRKLKGWNVKLISVWVGEGLFEQEPALMIQKIKAKASKHFIPIIFGIHAKISACLSADPRVVEIYVHDTTDRFLSFFSPPHNQFAKSLWSVRKQIQKGKLKKQYSPCQFHYNSSPTCPQKWSPYDYTTRRQKILKWSQH